MSYNFPLPQKLSFSKDGEVKKFKNYKIKRIYHSINDIKIFEIQKLNSLKYKKFTLNPYKGYESQVNIPPLCKRMDLRQNKMYFVFDGYREGTQQYWYHNTPCQHNTFVIITENLCHHSRNFKKEKKTAQFFKKKIHEILCCGQRKKHRRV